jgi:hypothetical protein
MKFEYPPGATPIDPDEAAGLIPARGWPLLSWFEAPSTLLLCSMGASPAKF